MIKTDRDPEEVEQNIAPLQGVIFSSSVLGFRSFHSLHPRLYRFVAFGDNDAINREIKLRDESRTLN